MMRQLERYDMLLPSSGCEYLDLFLSFMKVKPPFGQRSCNYLPNTENDDS